MSEDATPVRQQYLEIKKKYPDTIVFFRLGDFYETFDEDAATTSRELDLVLTSRNVAKGVRIPMAGIPYHAVENYLSRLIEKGYHVAICEQVGEQPSKGLFAREVVRIVTPGTLIEPGLLKSDSNNYLLAAVVEGEKIGISYADITTGEFFVTQIKSSNIQTDLNAEITRLRPAEILLPENFPVPLQPELHITYLPSSNFETARCAELMMQHFSVTTLDGFGIPAGSIQIQAAGCILLYLQKNQPSSLKLLTSISVYSVDEFMVLDASTRRNLELVETIRSNEAKGSLLGVLDCTVTPMGKRLIRQWVSKPLTNIKIIHTRQDAIESLMNNGMIRAELRQKMKGLNDIERLINRITGNMAQPRDLEALRSSLQILPDIIRLLEPIEPFILPASDKILPLQNVLAILQAAISDDPPATLQNTGIIRAGYSEELDQVHFESSHAREWMANLEGIEKERTGIKTLKVSYNKVFGYYIEISRGSAAQAPPEYIRKQTLVNAERFITPEMKEYETLVLNAEERIREIENRLFYQVCAEINQFSADILLTARSLAALDVLSSLAEIAAVNGYVRPEILEGNTIDIVGGRHPVVEQTLDKGKSFVPNDIRFENGEIIRIVTGPNMSGKSTFLRQTAIIILMAQMGSFVPAVKAKIGLVDRIFTRIGAQDEIHAGLSTFMVEMVETANILNNATPRSLLILDEIGRGTSTYDGLSIAWAVIEYIHNAPRLRARTIFATHYHELTKLPESLPGVRNYNVAVTEKGGEVIFLHKIIPGAADRSYGIHVGQIAGLPKPVISRANEILARLEAQSVNQAKIEELPISQLTLFPETNPVLDALEKLDVNSISPIEAINVLFEWKKRFAGGGM